MNLVHLKNPEFILSFFLLFSTVLPWCQTETSKMNQFIVSYEHPDCYIMTSIFGLIVFLTSITLGYLSLIKYRYTWILGIFCILLVCLYLIFQIFPHNQIEIGTTPNSIHIFHNPNIGLYIFLFSSLILTLVSFNNSLSNNS